MTTGKTIAKNASWLLMATFAQKFFAFLAFTIAARIVGPHVTGEYFFAVAITSTFVVIGDLGLTPVVIRAIAGNEERGRRFMGAALRLKALLIPIAIMASLVFGWLRMIETSVMYALLIMVLVMSADAIHLLFYGALRGRQLLRFEALGMFFGQLFSAVAAISAAVLGWGAPGLAFALLCGSVWNLGWSWLCTKRQETWLIHPKKQDYKDLMWQAVPFALAGIFVKVYSYLDTMVIEAFHGSFAVGNYAVAYKLTYALQFIPLVFVAALYPAMSAVYARRKKRELQTVFAGSLRLMAIAGAPIAAGLSAIAPRAIPLLYDIEFLGAVAPLTVLAWVLFPIFLDFPVGSLLNATNRAHLKTTAMGFAMLLNAALNFFFVPIYGPVGAAWAAIISFSVLTLIGLVFTRRELPSFFWIFSLIARSGIVSALIWFGVRYIGHIMPFAFAILFGAAIGITGLLVLQLLTISDLRSVFRWLHSRIRPVDPEKEEIHE